MNKFKLIAIGVMVIILNSCSVKEGTSVNDVVKGAKDDFEVTFLFEYEGLKIYRFYDDGHSRYFSIGNGKFLSQRQTKTTSNGKSTTTTEWGDGVD